MLAFSFSSGGGGGAPLVAKQSRERREVVVVRGGGGEALVSPRGGVGVHGEVHRSCDEHLDVLEEFVSLVEPLIGHRLVPLRAMLRVVADDLIAEVDDAVAHAASALRNQLLMILPEEDCAGNPAELHGFELATLANKLASLFPHSGDAVVVAMAEDDAESPDGEEEGAVEGGGGIRGWRAPRRRGGCSPPSCFSPPGRRARRRFPWRGGCRRRRRRR